MLRVRVLDDFRGERMVLAAMDRTGLEELESALSSLGEAQHETDREIAGRTMQFRIEAETNGLELASERVIWRLSTSTREEILEKLAVMKASSVPCHNYVDLEYPAPTLMLSLDEYVSSA